MANTTNTVSSIASSNFSSGDVVYYNGMKSVRLDFEKTDEHFIIKAGCETLVVHDFKEAKTKLMKLFTKEYKSFFDENNKST